jgi:hypothetical protein
LGTVVLEGENYRKKVLHCMLAADKARDPGVRLAWLSLARNYLALADYLDRQCELRTAHPGDQDQDKQKDR